MADVTPVKTEEQKPKSKLPLKTLLVIIGIFLLEAGTISIVWVVKSGPQTALATDPIAAQQESPNQDIVEVILAENMAVDNYSLGNKARIVVTLQVAAKTQSANQEKLKKGVEEHATEIQDSIRTLVSSADPSQIRDAKLEVVKRGIKTRVEEIIGEGLIEEILLPVWQSYTSE